MKQYTHAWISFMAIKRLRDSAAPLGDENGALALALARRMLHYEDDIIQGAWYPDAVIKDNANSHVLKITPSEEAENEFDTLPDTHLAAQLTENSPLRDESFEYDPHDNLPDRCESLTHSIVDHLKILDKEAKGSPAAPTNNQVSLWMLMLGHYVADAHVPFHCDARKYPDEVDVHGLAEKRWEDSIKEYYEIDTVHRRFFYDRNGFPLRRNDRENAYAGTWMQQVEQELAGRRFRIGYGTGRDRTWDFVRAICQRSYLLAYEFIPRDAQALTLDNWRTLGTVSFERMTVAVMADSIDSLARIWFRAWRRFMRWKNS